MKKLVLFGMFFLGAATLSSVLLGKPVFVYSGKTPMTVALTFDDGPKPDVTPKLLDMLKTAGAKATFFVVGRDCKLNPDLVLRMQKEGHEIGNHSYTHLRLDTVTPSQLKLEIAAPNEYLRSLTGKRVLFFRPPGGRYNDAVIREVEAQGMAMAMWNVNAGDYHFGDDKGVDRDKKEIKKASDEMLGRLLSQIKPGSIILLHNTGGETLMMIPKLVAGIQKKGLKLVTLSECVGLRKGDEQL